MGIQFAWQKPNRSLSTKLGLLHGRSLITPGMLRHNKPQEYFNHLVKTGHLVPIKDKDEIAAAQKEYERITGNHPDVREFDNAAKPDRDAHIQAKKEVKTKRTAGRKDKKAQPSSEPPSVPSQTAGSGPNGNEPDVTAGAPDSDGQAEGANLAPRGLGLKKGK